MMKTLEPNICTTPAGGRLISYVAFNVQQAYIHCGPSVELDFQPGTLRPRSRDLTTIPPRLRRSIAFPTIKNKRLPSKLRIMGNFVLYALCRHIFCN
ncbi:hypothetical protein AVEN_6284-1 [Araneus ventricosus]|uniref:Uncharacterized protein n=1 Tax=Araneus ventricosus TaxID=182803 RepID=A0A4Y2N3R2_ARAVE|nr:hypothetical protein AVEN_6284-1 [Araneus ventricosus]